MSGWLFKTRGCKCQKCASRWSPDKGSQRPHDISMFNVGLGSNKLANQKLFTDYIVDDVKCRPDGQEPAILATRSSSPSLYRSSVQGWTHKEAG
jgi:hypothetical protein